MNPLRSLYLRFASTLVILFVLAAPGMGALAHHFGAIDWQAGAWAFSLGLPVALAAGFITLSGLTRRLRRLAADVARFSPPDDADGDAPDKAAPGDEITALQSRFQQMARRIEAQMEELRHRDEQRRERVATLSHDLRTSLTVLHGYLETLQLKAGSLSEPERQRFIDAATRHSRRLARMANDFFELAKLECQEAAPRRERFALSELAREIVDAFQPLADARDIELRCEIGAGSYWVEGDIGMLGRVLENLVDNALKSTPAGRDVSVRMMSDGNQVRVVVEDTGSGMNADTLLKLAEGSVFRPSSHPERLDSSGLGLFIVKRILHRHGAHLTIESVAGRGSAFGFSLPLRATGSARRPVTEM